MMTGTHHATGTERCREVVDKLHLQKEEFDYVINIQGDEPYIKPEQIGQVASCFENPTTRLATLVKKINSLEELNSPNTVKAVLDNQGFAMFFSRAVIPFSRGKAQQDLLSGTIYFKHIGIYGYQSSVLNEIVALPVSELERSESLEQLRWLENGYRIKTQITEFESIAIDSPEDLLKITNKTGTNHG
jgi:3-deoxy-manno-octulosonate cytidylyltransferase (CMP-KDO synthetase)